MLQQQKEYKHGTQCSPLDRNAQLSQTGYEHVVENNWSSIFEFDIVGEVGEGGWQVAIGCECKYEGKGMKLGDCIE